METVQNLLDFISSSPSPRQLVHNCSSRLKDSGYISLDERDSWSLKSGQGYFTTREGSALIAFFPGKDMLTKGIRMVGTHTDSPGLHLKPQTPFLSGGVVQLAIEPYGGGLWNSWFDRDLSLTGTLYRKSGGEVIFDFKRSILRIPRLAIHLDREVNTAGFQVNRENHLQPLAGCLGANESIDEFFLSHLSELTGIAISDISTFEGLLYDVQQGAFSGFNDEFFQSSRLDNQAMCHAALESLIEHKNGGACGQLVVMFDHEEVGSNTLNGAAGSFLQDFLKRVKFSLDWSDEDYFRVLQSSFFVSADQAHAIHPNYPERHDKRDYPVLNGGPVLKFNSNYKYTTEAFGHRLMKSISRDKSIPLQSFSSRNDFKCGSTIGPAVCASLGIRGLDIGNPMLGMHSIRETAGSRDHESMISLLSGFFARNSIE